MIYSVLIDYIATGEGRHVWIGAMLDSNEQSAIKRFRAAFPIFEDNQAWEYFSLGIEVFQGLGPLRKQGIFTENFIDNLEGWLPCGPEMFFSFDINCS